MNIIIEHLDPRVFKWSLLEYSHISATVGPAKVMFTNVQKKEHEKLQELGSVCQESIITLLKKKKQAFNENPVPPVTDRWIARPSGSAGFSRIQIFSNDNRTTNHQLETGGIFGFDPRRICILDPQAKQVLSPSDAKLFDHFLFGGVLGNHPMDGRTEKKLTKQLPDCPIRNLGQEQMSTDTAVLVTHMIIDKKIPFDQLQFQDTIEIELEDGYSNILPYRYLMQNGKAVLPDGLIKLLQEEEDVEE